MVTVIHESFSMDRLPELTIGKRLFLHAQVNRSLIDGKRVKRCKHAYVREHGIVVLRVTVAGRRYVKKHVDVEIGASIHHGLGIFRDTAAQQFVGLVIFKTYRVEIKCTYKSNIFLLISYGL